MAAEAWVDTSVAIGNCVLPALVKRLTADEAEAFSQQAAFLLAAGEHCEGLSVAVLTAAVRDHVRYLALPPKGFVSSAREVTTCTLALLIVVNDLGARIEAYRQVATRPQ